MSRYGDMYDETDEPRGILPRPLLKDELTVPVVRMRESEEERLRRQADEILAAEEAWLEECG